MNTITASEAKAILQEKYLGKTICPTYTLRDDKYYSGYYLRENFDAYPDSCVQGVSVDQETGKVEEISAIQMVLYNMSHDVQVNRW